MVEPVETEPAPVVEPVETEPVETPVRRLTDEHLDAVLIGGREQRAIEVVDYRDEWPGTFGEWAATVRAAVGPLALAVEHIGSTSVPGLAAKPIIDMLLVVPDVAAESDYLPALEAAGLVLRVREPNHRMVRTPERDVHLHIYSAGAPEITDYLDLRDWLRASAEDRELYASIKKELAAREWPDMNYYAEAKDDVVATVLAHARQWRAAGSPA
ncbi:GrpB family protein [Pseudarthrobacter sp. J75]|uniref:GrpB family protein n=1 Tax=unclassified Pseudarthrobacter TaxID=2647000 RepID=UPI002E7FB8D6|nr:MULTISPECIES: GrpB family protein [unclassified Pseudarthrobacter]MEE2524194.1 GrpB family protein [Pseudarthrobacter sp. J47]MEE2530232.1 GrpB family protein [Pseudarthrobacter sp. J75]MEE2568898.1 GrpB family protein [Pseudarthrobacter sp. J64]